MASDYLAAPTTETRLFQLYRKKDKPQELDPAMIARLLRATTAAMQLIRAKSRKSSAIASEEKYRQKVLDNFPVGQFPGFIGRYGMQWVRVLITPGQASLKLSDPAGLLNHLSGHLAETVSLVTVELPPAVYDLLRSYLSEHSDQDLGEFVKGLVYYPEVVADLVKNKELSPPPGTLFKLGDVPGTTVLPSIVPKPI